MGEDTMAQQSNLEIVRETYEVSRELKKQCFLNSFAENAEWTEAKGFPYAGTYVGVDSIMKNVFDRLTAEWIYFKANVFTYYEVTGQNIIITEGVYKGRYKETEKDFEADFIHVWELSGGEIQKFKQYVDSHIVQQAMI